MLNRALWAHRLSCIADFPSQTDDVQVGGVVSLWREDGFEMGVCLLYIHLFGAQTNATRDAVHVCIHGEGRAP